MFLTHAGKPAFDYDLDLLREIALLLDSRLDTLDREIQQCSDPDGFGLYESAESLCGIGFVACQQYLMATASWLKIEKKQALSCGPVHACGDTIVSIVNHAANYWKHGDEWLLGKSEKQQVKTQDGLEAILSDFESGYALTVILARLISPLEPWRFKHLLPMLASWRDDMVAKFPGDKS